MRSKVLLTGVILLLIGIYLIYGGTGLVKALALSTATTYVKTEAQKPMLLTVDEDSFTYLSTDLSVDNLRSLKVSYTATGDVNFYVMDEMEFEAWRNEKPTTVSGGQNSTFPARSGNFTFTPEHGGTYYFVFDNPFNSVKRVMVNLSNVRLITETSPAVEYLPHGLIIIGVVLMGFGLGGKRKPKPPSKDRATLERIARNLGINSHGLADDELREEIRREVATQED